ncbi:MULTISPECIES: hypothetical protein [Halorubrum]|uniref:Uncharacterized protein n=1 Tax=Halorubrum persicum TaxID=1383844 RepID=A0A2G1WN91_9EURY|nr:hypothetical protein [Halorubrum persicum]PHQ40339.1 hypothetical protein DJ69_01655 [Halorubrum persicum]
MTRKYSFETKTINGQQFVIADGRGQSSEPIRVRADWIESDDMEGKWEDLIKQIVQPENIDQIDIDEGHGGINRREAVEALAGATADGETIVSSEQQADVLVEYLAEEDIVEIEGEELVLFRDPDEESLNSAALMNWAALMSAVIESIDEHLERVEDAKERFQETVDTLEVEQQDSEERLSKTAQRIQNLGPGQGVPDPDTLSDEERQEYTQLKEHYLYLQDIEKAKSENFVENVSAGVDQIGMAIERLEAAREAYDMFHNNTRKAALKSSVFPEEALEFVDNAGSLINELAGQEESQADDVADEDFAEMIEENHGEAVQEQAAETANLAETAEEAAGFKR